MGRHHTMNRKHFRIRRRIAGALTAIAMVASIMGAPAHANFGPSMGHGIGYGFVYGKIRGDFMDARPVTGLYLGMDYESPEMFAMVEASAALSNCDRAKSVTMAIGGGVRLAKIGVAAATRKSSACAVNDPKFPGYSVYSKEASYNTASFPVYLRLHPLDTQTVLATIDAYYGFATKGSGRVWAIAPTSRHSETTAQTNGGNSGYRAELLFRLGAESNQAVMIDYRIDKGKMDQTKPVPNGTTGLPIGFTNRLLMIGYHTLF